MRDVETIWVCLTIPKSSHYVQKQQMDEMMDIDKDVAIGLGLAGLGVTSAWRAAAHHERIRASRDVLFAIVNTPSDQYAAYIKSDAFKKLKLADDRATAAIFNFETKISNFLFEAKTVMVRVKTMRNIYGALTFGFAVLAGYLLCSNDK